ncbi:unnamed protein product [Cylindrotheca closterium]|uniref:Uncharacterized protein n=1 Tax=Cylindrotheca closterium TaxID=2856 RepID=A0AAD2GEA2_9STRA|nr:unnamed protein product [Cylindrotheca closterium]
MVLIFAKVVLSALLLLLSFPQNVRSQSLLLSLQQGAGNENHGSVVGLTNKNQPPYVAANQEATIRKSNKDFPQMTFNRQLLQDNDGSTITWDHAVTFQQTDGWSHSQSGDGTFLAASDHRSSNNGIVQNGSVRFFRKEQGSCGGSSWKEWTNLALFGNSTGDNFGWDISLSKDGNRVAIGATGSGNVGSVAVYELVNGAWALMGVIQGEAEDDTFGYSVSLSKDGSRVAIGDRYRDSFAGNARVYEWEGSSFLKLGDDMNGECSEDQAGADLALSEDGLVVVIGDRKFVRVFEWSGGSWTKRGLNFDGSSWAPWGYSLEVSVALSGDGNIVAFGLFRRVQVFEWKDFEWIQVGQTLKVDDEDVIYGQSVSLSSSGSILAVGSRSNNASLPAKMYALADGIWVDQGGSSGSNGARVSVSSDGFTLAVGDWRSDSISIYNLNGPLDTTTPTCRPTPSPTSSLSSGPSIGPTFPQSSGPSMAPSSGPTSSGCNGNFHWEFFLSSVIFLPCLLLSASF